MTEAQLLTAVTCGTRTRPGLCARLGIWWHHERDSRGTTPGWPDLVMLGSRGWLLAELKGPRGRRTPEQTDIAWRLLALGLPYRVWTPADLDSGAIWAELREIA